MKIRLELARVSKAFGSHEVLNQAWLQVRAGEAVGLLGANGAGKTTLLRIAAGLMTADRGSVRRVAAEPFTPPRLCYYGGEATLPPHVSARRWAALFAVVAADRRPIGRLSRGNRQALGLRVLLSGPAPDILLLDEPWEGLDPPGSAWLTDALCRVARAGAAVLISSHRLHDLDSVCTRFVMLDGGRCLPIVPHSEQPRIEQIAQAFVRPRR